MTARPSGGQAARAGGCPTAAGKGWCGVLQPGHQRCAAVPRLRPHTRGRKHPKTNTSARVFTPF